MRAVLWALTGLVGTVLGAPHAAACIHDPVQPCPGIHPGALFQAKGANGVSVHFLFVAPTGIYVGSCAHCVDFGANLHPTEGWFLDAWPNRTVTPDTPADADIVWIHSGWTGEQVETDMALLKLREPMWGLAQPALPRWGGPSGVHDTVGLDPRVVHHGGSNVALRGTPAEQRTGFLLDWGGGPRFSFTGSAEVGDSGSPVIDADRAAVGYITHGLGTTSSPGQPGGTGNVHGLHVSAFLTAVEGATGLTLRLVLDGEDPVALMESMRADAQAAAPTAPPGRQSGASAGLGLLLAVVAAALVRKTKT
jgi:trypsin